MAVVAAILIIALVTIISIGKLESRTREQRDLERQLEETSRTLEKTRKDLERLGELGHEQVPLLVPTSFVYLDKDTVESLYGQYEPDLVPALALEEIQQASEIKGGVSLQGYISTEAGQKELNRRVTEYRSVQKNTERKLKDLIRFLYDLNLFKTFRDIQPKSDKLSELDKASNLLVQKYNVTVGKEKLQSTREELLKEELILIQSELQNLKGLAFIEGDWSVNVQPTEYIFRRPFVNVSSAPVCEVRLSKSNVSSQYRDIVENLAKKPIRLSFFGNALVGLSDDSRTILLKPVAIF